MKAKHLGRALEQIAEEGGAQVFKMFLGSDFIVGVVGALQFEVLADRIRPSTTCPATSRPPRSRSARWVDADDPKLIKKFADANRDNIARTTPAPPCSWAATSGSSTAPGRTSRSSGSSRPRAGPADRRLGVIGLTCSGQLDLAAGDVPGGRGAAGGRTARRG